MGKWKFLCLQTYPYVHLNTLISYGMQKCPVKSINMNFINLYVAFHTLQKNPATERFHQCIILHSFAIVSNLKL